MAIKTSETRVMAGRTRLRASSLRGIDNPLSRIISRLNSGHDHGLYTTIVEEILICLGVKRLIGKPIWDRMKKDIELSFSSAPEAGGAEFVRQLILLWSKNPEMRVTLIGYSAGAIYLQRFVECLDAQLARNAPQKVEIITLAAATSFERVAQGLSSLRRRVLKARTFGLNDAREGGYWEIRPVYNKSLLYIVSSLCDDDPNDDRPILGMQRYWNAKGIYNVSPIKDVIAFISQKNAVWAPSAKSAPGGYRSNARRHGGFPLDDETRKSVCYALKHGL